MAKSVVNRYKKPSFFKLVEIEEKLNITSKQLDDLTKSYIKNDTKSSSGCTTTT